MDACLNQETCSLAAALNQILDPLMGTDHNRCAARPGGEEGRAKKEKNNGGETKRKLAILSVWECVHFVVLSLTEQC